MILTIAQAQAIYEALCAVDKAGGSRFSIVIPGKDTNGRSTCTEVRRVWPGAIVVETIGYRADHFEDYENKAAFALAYGVQP